MRTLTGYSVYAQAVDVEAGDDSHVCITVHPRGQRPACDTTYTTEFYLPESPPHLIWDRLHQLVADHEYRPHQSPPWA